MSSHSNKEGEIVRISGLAENPATAFAAVMAKVEGGIERPNASS